MFLKLKLWHKNREACELLQSLPIESIKHCISCGEIKPCNICEDEVNDICKLQICPYIHFSQIFTYFLLITPCSSELRLILVQNL